MRPSEKPVKKKEEKGKEKRSSLECCFGSTFAESSPPFIIENDPNRNLEKREKDIEKREEEIEKRGKEIEKREKDIEKREEDIGKLERDIKKREKDIEKREKDIEKREEEIEKRENIEKIQYIDKIEEDIDPKIDEDTEEREEDIEKRVGDIEKREENIEKRERDTEKRERDIEKREKDIEKREEDMEKRKGDIIKIEEDIDPKIEEHKKIEVPLVTLTTVEILYNHLECVNHMAFATIVDLRCQSDFNSGHIPGAFSLPLESVGEVSKEFIFEKLTKKGQMILEPNCKYFFYSSSDIPSSTLSPFTTILQNQNKKCRFYNVQGGYQKWQTTFPILSESEPPSLRIPTLSIRVFPSVIIPDFLYLGCVGTTHPQVLNSLGIRFVLSAAREVPKLRLVKQMRLELTDNTYQPISVDIFKKSFKFINKAAKKKKKVLVHCAAGISRSPTIVIAYLMYSQNLTFRQSFKFVQMNRSFIDPNPGFVKILRDLETEFSNDIINNRK